MVAVPVEELLDGMRVVALPLRRWMRRTAEPDWESCYMSPSPMALSYCCWVRW